MSPAMAAGVSGRLWEIGDIVALVEAAEAKPGKRAIHETGCGLAYVSATFSGFPH